jgi:hypothetical protein
MKLHRRGLFAATGALTVAVTAALVLGATAPAGASHLTRRPGAAASGTSASAMTSTPGFSPFGENFKSGKGNFCDNTADNPCDGNAGAFDYGTADGALPVKFSNYGFGNYATSLTKLPAPTATKPSATINEVARIAGSTATNQGLACQTAGTEGCTGPYLEPAGQDQYAFPANGYTVTVHQWIDPAYTAAAGNANGAGAQVDTDLGIDQSGGTSGSTSYGQDEVISTCGGIVSFGNSSPGACGSGPAQITAAGWYRYVFVVSRSDGNVSVTARVLDESGTLLFDSGPKPVSFGATPATTTNTGGMRYLWWPTLNVDGLPVGAVFYQAGQHLSGHVA